MSATLARIQSFIAQRHYFISRHALDEAEDDAINVSELLAAMLRAQVVEDYPDATRGPSVLCLVNLPNGTIIHAVWGIPKAEPNKTGLVTTYRPDSKLWSPDFMKRIAK